MAGKKSAVRPPARAMEPLYRDIRAVLDAPRLEFAGAMTGTKRDAPRLVSAREAIRHMACGELSWSHYRLLLQEEDPKAREWYLRETADCAARGKDGA